MFDSQCDLAALVYEQDQDPDEILRAFASDLNSRGYRAVGLVQLGHHCLDAPKLSAMLVHTGEELQLFQNLGACATGCRLDVGQLLDAGAQVASAIDQGADLVIVNIVSHWTPGGMLFQPVAVAPSGVITGRFAKFSNKSPALELVMRRVW